MVIMVSKQCECTYVRTMYFKKAKMEILWYIIFNHNLKKEKNIAFLAHKFSAVRT